MQVADRELYRAKPGEVLVHTSHPGQPIHAETNPCPDGRGLYVLDWSDIPRLLREEQEPAAEGDGGGDRGVWRCGSDREDGSHCSGNDRRPSPVQSSPVNSEGGNQGGSKRGGKDGSKGGERARRRPAKACRVLPCVRMPTKRIIESLRVLADERSESFQERLANMAEACLQLLPEASTYPGGREAVEHLRVEVLQAQATVQCGG